jgi:hypothetical protein
MSTEKNGFGGLGPDLDSKLIYLNGINPDTGTYAVPPFSIDSHARKVLSHPGGGDWLSNGLGNILSGVRVGHAVAQQFGPPYAALSVALLNYTAPGVPASMRHSDRELVGFWLERNDAQNYVTLGDPAVRIRPDDLGPVRNGTTIWLLIGNGQSSNQPNDNPFAPSPGKLPAGFKKSSTAITTRSSRMNTWRRFTRSMLTAEAWERELTDSTDLVTIYYFFLEPGRLQ